MISIDEDCRRLLALLTHEMRSPGAVVAGYLRMLKGPSISDMPSREQKMIEEANRSCARLMHIVQELSDFRQLVDNNELQREPVAIFGICEEVVQKAVDEGCTVDFVVDEGDREATVDGDELKLRQAISALLACSCREHGTLALVETRAFVHRNGSGALAVIAFGEPGSAECAEDVLKHREMVFDQWRGGMGLALPIAQQIVEVHHGNVWAIPGMRASCAVSLPLTA
jgi:signal transduction histidine kinase